MVNLSISCVIPTHKRSEFLAEALRSVTAQTRPPQEIIVVSDCIDPDSRDVCSAFPGVVYLEYEDAPGGASSSRNRGAAAATGDFVAFLDDDDLWEPSYLSTALSKLHTEGSDLVVTWMLEFSGEQTRPGGSMRAGLLAEDVLAINPGATGSNIVIRRSIVDQVGGFDVNLPVKNDTDFLARVMREGSAYSVVEERLVKQRKHDRGQLTAVDETRARGTEAYLQKHLAYLSRSDIRLLRQSIHRIRSRCASSPLARGYHLARVALYYPPRELLNKLRAGRDRSQFAVKSFANDKG